MIASENTVQNEYGNDYIYNLDSHTPFKSFVSEQKNTDVKKFRFVGLLLLHPCLYSCCK